VSKVVEIQPSDRRELRDILFEQGVEFPCGGESLCGGCRIRVLEGDIPVTPDMRAALTEQELADGWRLGCRAQRHGLVRLAVGQWSTEVLTDEARVPFEPAAGWGAAIDLGTTTLVVQLVNLATGEVEAVRTALNPQARYGADIMTRIQFDLERPGVLTALIRESLGGMLADAAAGRAVEEVLIVGNTAMHHLFCGESVEPLSHVPFRSPALASRNLDARELGWTVRVKGTVQFVGCIGGFVGSDLLAGLLATGFLESDRDRVLMDLGTNGEIAAGNRHGIRCASTAAGPAFEAGRIGMGMRAAHGAIDRVDIHDGTLRGRVIGGGVAAGICGSGLVDAAAAALDLGLLDARGRVQAAGKRISISPEVSLAQADIRELQLAKGAVAAGLALLAAPHEQAFHLAGAFGNYVRAGSASRIGLLPDWAHPVQAAGNTALRGARMLLLAPSRRKTLIETLSSIATHVELHAQPAFEDRFVDCMAFP
jgi:uncharacterized 2Fe-2S/4Fe-4S cluster protein (DUF4445 family)